MSREDVFIKADDIPSPEAEDGVPLKVVGIVHRTICTKAFISIGTR